ncbi:hypothetical protein [Pedobacter sp. SL55]|uniref:hypothetical protein n=1 Tax=Pedobacter sp. SL55 TaxID=2995161 RepID=UPI00226D7621|nr:hypothetical protein [Pedobacter sp. SL55]WAC39051.1 hypothetical protein OVA16_10530 [Pedobacter sp. SL55]
MKVIVSHPGKQHAYKLLIALQQLGIEVTFCTSFALKKQDNYFANRFFGKRLLINSNVALKTFPILELIRLLGRKIIKPIVAQHYFERTFDRLSSNWLKRQEFDIFIGYECSSRLCFEVCREMGKVSLLDLAQIHYNELKQLGKEYECLNYLLEDGIRSKIDGTKHRELELCSKILSISSFVKESLLKNNIPKNKIFDLPIGNKSIVKNIKKRNRINLKSSLLVP